MQFKVCIPIHLALITLYDQTVFVLLLSMSPAKSSSLDPIPTWLPKHSTTTISAILCHLCNLSFQHSTLSTQLKQDWVIPHPKKSTVDPDTANSYRPTSNLSFISKLVEHLIAKCFISHVNLYSLFPAQQSTYQPFQSTETAILKVHNDLVHAIDNCHVSQMVLLDLNAAFKRMLMTHRVPTKLTKQISRRFQEGF